MPINPNPIIPGTSPPDGRKDKMSHPAVKDTIQFLLSEPSYTFADMVLTPELENAIQDALAIFEYREQLFDVWNLSSVIKRPNNLCLNLYGEPGTGKTMAANAIANQLGLKLLRVNYADIESKYVGETSKNLERLFVVAKERNAVILFDEADALLSRRVTDMTSATDVSVNQTRSVLLSLLDGYDGMVIFTTNFISNYDPAFMRRIPYHIKFELPDEAQRAALLTHYLTGTVPNDIDIPYIAEHFSGIAGGDIANALLTSALKTARERRSTLRQSDFEAALFHILQSKHENRGEHITVESREVTEEYAQEQLEKHATIGRNDI